MQAEDRILSVPLPPFLTSGRFWPVDDPNHWNSIYPDCKSAEVHRDRIRGFPIEADDDVDCSAARQ